MCLMAVFGQPEGGIYMPNSNKHLTLEERRIILTGIKNGSTKKSIADTLGKEKSTIGKEIKLHRYLASKCKMPLECSNYRKCPYERKCQKDCPEYAPFKCSRRDRSPGSCDGCSKWSSCRFDKYRYNPETAEDNYKNTLVDSRIGVNLTTSEAKALADIIAPLLKQGLTPYQIVQIHPEVGVCEKTIYNYIENGLFSELSDISVMDLRRQVSRKPTKKKKLEYKKRNSIKQILGRTYKDYTKYVEENPDILVTQMDTVYNDISNGPFLQTFKFMSCGLMFALYHKEKTAAAMVSGVNTLEKILGRDVFNKHVSVLLTDRGSEFYAAEEIETAADESRRTRLFYCDPMQSGQKGSLENNHILLRYILPKGINLVELGLTGQEALNLVLSHINSAPIEKFGGKSPLEMAKFMYNDLYQELESFGIRIIEKDKIILKPYLIKDFKN